MEYIPGRPPGRPEYGDMFGGWLAESAGRTILVDTGVGAGAADLASRLKSRLAGRGLDYVLLTHIHLDHAGGLGEIFKTWPEARAVVHEKGRGHLADPDRLWAGTQMVMREISEIYGRPAPADPARLISHLDPGLAVDLPALTILETPGHAAHHLSFCLDGVWFVGEAGGSHYLTDDGRLYSRPASPPSFFPGPALASLDRLLAESDGPAYYSHLPERLTLKPVLMAARRQLLLWDSLLRPDSPLRPGETPEARLDRLADLLRREDPELQLFMSLPPLIREAEKFFLRSAIEGFLGSLEAAGEAAHA